MVEVGEQSRSRLSSLVVVVVVAEQSRSRLSSLVVVAWQFYSSLPCNW